MTVEFVIFDFDGTLADSLPWLLAVFDQMAECYGFKKLDRSEIDAVRHCNTHQVMSHYGIAAWKLPFILWHLRLLMRQDSHSIKPVPGIEAALRSLAGRGIVLGILSSNTRENIRRVLGRETAALFRYWECDSSIFGKTARLRKLVRAARYTNEEVMFVGDEIRDADAAREAQVPFGAVAWGYTHLRSLAAGGVRETFADPAELVTKLVRPHGANEPG